MAFTEDPTEFLATADFATAMTYKPLGVGSGTTVNVIFDEPDQDHLGITGTRPTVRGQASDFVGMRNTDTLTNGSTVYRIVEMRPVDDGTFVDLQLEKQ